MEVNETEAMEEMKKQLKEHYPDMTCMLTRVDFDRIAERTKKQIGINSKCPRGVLSYLKGMSFTYSSHVLQQVWEVVSTSPASLT